MTPMDITHCLLCKHISYSLFSSLFKFFCRVSQAGNLITLPMPQNTVLKISRRHTQWTYHTMLVWVSDNTMKVLDRHVYFPDQLILCLTTSCAALRADLCHKNTCMIYRVIYIPGTEDEIIPAPCPFLCC